MDKERITLAVRLKPSNLGVQFAMTPCKRVAGKTMKKENVSWNRVSI